MYNLLRIFKKIEEKDQYFKIVYFVIIIRNVNKENMLVQGGFIYITNRFELCTVIYRTYNSVTIIFWLVT